MIKETIGFWKQTYLWKKIMIALFLGAITGYLLGDKAIYLKPFGDVFINLIKMIIVPLVFFSIAASITSMESTHSLGKTGGRVFFLFLLTTSVSVVVGLFFAEVFNPSAGVVNPDLFTKDENMPMMDLSFIDTLVNMIPTNPVKAMADGNFLQIIVFAFFFGTAVNLAGKKVKKIANALSDITDVIYSLTEIIMKFAPYGVFALIGWVVGTQDAIVLAVLLKYIIVVIVASLFQLFVVNSCFLLIFARLNPLTFFKKIIDAQILAFSTASSSATLPVTMKVAEEKLGVSKETANFSLPLGATINMNGSGVFLAIATVFLADINGIVLGFSDYVTILFTVILVAIGSSGTPGSSFAMMPIIFVPLGIPLSGIALLITVDRILDMFRTVLNITGDLLVATIVDKKEKKLDRKLFELNKAEIEL